MSVNDLHAENIHDLIGVGFGPAGIALAVAMEDANEERSEPSSWKSLFIEQAPDSSWQPNMLLSGTDIQHHWLRDFATPRNPRSRFTFPYYLQQKGRLFTFGLLGCNASRIEWSDYVRWVAKQVAHYALYRHRVIAIEPVDSGNNSPIHVVRIRAQEAETGATKEFYARNIVLGTGRKPNIPEIYTPYLGDRIFHSHYFTSHIQHINADQRPTFAVVGSGQNAIEVVLYLASHFPHSEIYSINRNGGFRTYDLGHFSNEVYHPADVDYFYSLPKSARRQVEQESKYTNYSSVDPDVSHDLYAKVYEEEVQGIRRIHVMKRSSVLKVIPHHPSFELCVEDRYLHSTKSLRADVVILCTGFTEEQNPTYLHPLAPYMQVDDDGDFLIERDYEVKTDDRMQVGIFFNGLTERTHGISDSASFSMMALKAQRTLERLEMRQQLSSMDLTTDGDVGIAQEAATASHGS